MPIWEPVDLKFDADAVLRGQGADPEIIRKRSSHLVEKAERALETGIPLLTPQVIYLDLSVGALHHQRLILEGNVILSGELVSKHLGLAEKVTLFLCTIGNALENYATLISKDDIVYGLALDGVGSAAVEALANAACKFFETQAAGQNLYSFTPISPGMLGWSVNVGQPEIFSILKPEQINVSLSKHGLIEPRKSLTMALGFGSTRQAVGRTCDYCVMRETCRYQDQYDSIRF